MIFLNLIWAISLGAILVIFTLMFGLIFYFCKAGDFGLQLAKFYAIPLGTKLYRTDNYKKNILGAFWIIPAILIFFVKLPIIIISFISLIGIPFGLKLIASIPYLFYPFGMRAKTQKELNYEAVINDGDDSSLTNDFNSMYNKSLKGDIEELEPIRKKELLSNIFKIKAGLKPAIILASILFVAFKFLNGATTALAIGMSLYVVGFFFFGFSMLYILTSAGKYTEYAKLYKEKILSKMLLLVDSEINYEAENFIPVEVANSSGLFVQSYTDVTGEDLFYTNDYKLSELSYKYKKTTSDGDKTAHDRGLLYMSSFNKSLKNVTYLKSKFTPFYMGNIQGVKCSKVNLESVDFDSLFDVFSSDEVEARYIFSSSLMDKLVEYNKIYKLNLRMAFKENSFFIKISQQRNMFNPTGFFNFKVSNLEKDYRLILFLNELREELHINLNLYQ